MEAPQPRISVVLPAWNEAGNVAPMTGRLKETLDALAESYEIVWVNDGSTDATGDALDTLAAEDPRVRVLHFSRNFGHMAALCAGLEAARASGAIISMDADGQHPPEMIPELVARWKNGVDIVQTIRNPSGREGFLKAATSRGFYRVLSLLADIDLPNGAADFRLMDRQAVDALNNLPERVRFVRGLVHWVGFEREYYHYDPVDRLSGETKYSFFKMFTLAFNGLTSFSVRPLRLSFVLALLVILLAFLYGVFVLWAYLVGLELTPGWASTLIVIMVLGSAQLFAIGIASEYLARAYVEQKQRPVYILRKARAPRDAAE
ncbi:MAG: glycosyltransferase family 2 protein [Candidatus Hydrogenedentes bacterium]|nr:glycosyltransferase family 2 protein [Candidatus Hydrogenedentota bacterium]